MVLPYKEGDQELGPVGAAPSVPRPTGECRVQACRRSVSKDNPAGVSRFVGQTSSETEPTVDSAPLETVDPIRPAHETIISLPGLAALPGLGAGTGPAAAVVTITVLSAVAVVLVLKVSRVAAH